MADESFTCAECNEPFEDSYDNAHPFECVGWDGPYCRGCAEILSDEGVR